MEQPRTHGPAAIESLPMKRTTDNAVAFSETESRELNVVPSRILRRPHMLQVLAGMDTTRTIPVVGAGLTIGRSMEADLRIMSSELSRLHLRIEQVREGYRALDLDSRNGVFLNEVRIHSATLRDGDTVQLGNVVLMYHEGS